MHVLALQNVPKLLEKPFCRVGGDSAFPKDPAVLKHYG